jgi:hypothetical protein
LLVVCASRGGVAFERPVRGDPDETTEDRASDRATGAADRACRATGGNTRDDLDCSGRNARAPDESIGRVALAAALHGGACGLALILGGHGYEASNPRAGCGKTTIAVLAPIGTASCVAMTEHVILIALGRANVLARARTTCTLRRARSRAFSDAGV